MLLSIIGLQWPMGPPDAAMNNVQGWHCFATGIKNFSCHFGCLCETGESVRERHFHAIELLQTESIFFILMIILFQKQIYHIELITGL